MKSKFTRVSAMLSVAIGALVLSSAAQAQSEAEMQQDSTARQSDAGASNATVEDIVVTAQFRGQNLQDTPLAISAVTGESAAARSQFSINDIAKTTPSVNIETGSGTGGSFPTVFIRGVGQADPFPPLDPGVGIYIDDVYYGILTGANFDLLDLDRVEILRGPQGTLAGKNSEGGAIKIFTNQPTNDFSGYVEASYGSYDRKQIRGAINVPIMDDTVLLRVSGMSRSVDGFFKRLDFGCVNPGTLAVASVAAVKGCEIGRAGGGNLTAFKGTLLIKPTDNVRNTMSYISITDKQEVAPLKLLFQDDAWRLGYDFITGPKELTNYATYVGNQYSGTTRYQGIAHNHVKQEVFSNILDIDISDSLSFKSITAYVKTDSEGGYDNDLSPLSVSLQEILVQSEQFTQEVRLSGSSSLLDWTVGGFYFDNDILFPGRINVNRGFNANGIPGFTLDFLTNDVIKARSKSGFAHAVVHLTDSLNVTGGIRYTDDFKSYTFIRLDPDGSPSTSSLGAINGLRSTFSGKRWDYRVAADYRFSPEFLVYAQFATGYKGGGINPRVLLPGQEQPYGAESVKSFEAGFKSDLFDRRVRLNVTGFYQKFDDIQLQLGECSFLPGTPLNGPCNLTANAGKARIQGGEAELEFRPVDNLSINASASIVDFKYTDIDLPQSGVLLTDKAPFISKYKFSIGAQYEIAAFGGAVTPRIDLDYRSAFSSGAQPTTREFNFVEGRTLVNARVSYKPDGDDNWEFSLAATNLLDKFYYVMKHDEANGGSGGVATGLVGRPREVMVTVKRSF